MLGEQSSKHVMEKGREYMSSENMVQCDFCMKKFCESEIIYDEALYKEVCPYCGRHGYIAEI